MAAFYGVILFREISISSGDGVTLRIVAAFVFFATVLMILGTKIPLMIKNGFGIMTWAGVRYRSSHRAGSESRKSGSNSSFQYSKPEDLLGNLILKYNTLTKENQIAMCIKHIEMWKHLMMDAEIPIQDEGRNANCVVSPTGSPNPASARNPISASARARKSVASNYSSNRSPAGAE